MSDYSPSRPIAALQFFGFYGGTADIGMRCSPEGSVANDPHRHKGSRLRCAARFNDDAGTWYADLITIACGEPNEAERVHRPYRWCGGAGAVSSARRAGAGARTHLQTWHIDR